MNSSKVTKPTKRERTRALLIDAALDVLSVRGLEATSIDDFMDVAGMARSTFYNYFQSRDDVLVAVSQHIEEQAIRHVISCIPTDVDDETKIASATLGLLGFFTNNPRLGWVQVRLSGGLRWLEKCNERSPQFLDIDRAISAVSGDEVPLLSSVIYLEGAILMLLRRLLERRVTEQEAEKTLLMVFRGLGMPEHRLAPVLHDAKLFATSLAVVECNP